MRGSPGGRQTRGGLGAIDGGVVRIIAGTNITISPATGTGDVTINATTSGGGATTVPLIICDDLADLAAVDVSDATSNPTGTQAYVVTLQDFFQLDRASTATVDTANYLVVDADTGVSAGRWFRACTANEKWLNTTSWFIDGDIGDNENSGATSLLPLRSWSELDRRLHGLTYNASAVTVSLLSDLENTDPIRVTFGVENASSTPTFGTLTITGTRTTIRTGTLTDVENLNSTATSPLGGQPNEVEDTTITNWTDYIHKYVRFLNGASFRCSGWVAKDLGSDRAYISPTINNDNNTSITQTNPVTGDNYEIYSFSTAPGFALEVDNKTIVQLRNIDFTPSSGTSVPFTLNNGAIARVQACSFGLTTSFRNSAGSTTVYNCLVAGGGTHTMSGSATTFNAGLFTGAINTSTNVTFDGRFLFSNLSGAPVMFRGMVVQFNGATVDDGKLLIIDAPSTNTSVVRLLSTSLVTLTELWGGGNDPSSAALIIGKYDQRLDVLTTLNLDFGEGPMAAALGVEPVFREFLTDITNISDFRDTYGNILRGPGGGSPATFGGKFSTNPPTMRDCGENLGVFRVVRQASDESVYMAKADTAAHATGVCGVSTSVNTTGGRVTFVTSGSCVLTFDESDPVAGSLVYLSPTTAGYGTTTPPAVSGTNQVLRLGYVVRQIGGATSFMAIVAFHPELIPVTAA